MGTIGVQNIPSKAPLIVFIYYEKGAKQSKSNEYLYLQHIIPYHMERGCLKPDILHEFRESFLAETTQWGPWGYSIYYPKLL